MKEKLSNWWFNFSSAIEEHAILIEAVLTSIAIIVATFVWIETHNQVIESRKQVEESKKAVASAESTLKYQRWRDSMNDITQKAIADKSIALSEKIAGTQERFTKIELRAYLTINLADLQLKVGEKPRYILKLANVGKTPSYDMILLFGWKIGDGIYDSEIKKMIHTKTGSTQGNILGGGQNLNVPIGRTVEGPKFSITDSIAAFHSPYRLYLYGEVRYKDRFGEQHFTRYAVYLHPTTDLLPPYGKYNDGN